VLRYLVEKGVNLNSVVPREKCTPLQHAAEKGNRRIIDLLLDLGADINGHPIAFHVRSNTEDQHVTIQLPLSSSQSKLRIRLRNDFGLSMSQELPPLGESSQGLRIVSESWTPALDQLTLKLSGSSNRQYDLAVWNPGQIASVDGAQLLTDSSGAVNARVQFPAGGYSRQIAFHFKSRGKNLP